MREYLMAQINAAEKRADLRFEHMKETVEAAFRSAQMAIDKADTATEKRFEGVNEFRAALSDQAVNFVTRDAMSSLGEKLEAAVNRQREDLDNLAKRVDLREGQSAGSKITTTALVTIITVAIGLIGVIILLANFFSR